MPFPFFFQDGPLHGILVDRVSIFVIHEGHKFPKQALLPHSQLPAQLLAGEIIVLGVGIDPARALLIEQIIEEGLGRLEGVAFALIVRV